MAFVMPVNGPITQPFGCTGQSMQPPQTWHGTFCEHFHGGIDISAPTGTPIKAASSGYVRAAGWDISIAQGGGYSVWVQHGPNLHTVYSHCSTLNVVAGQQVVAGQKIAEVGATGNVTGAHLHFAVWTVTAEWGFDVDDPMKFLPGGTNANDTIYTTDDIPWLEPLDTTLVRMALFQPMQNGTYSAPTSASSIVNVYFDRVWVSPSQYSIVRSNSGRLYVYPKTPLSTSVEVRGDYIV